MTKDESEMRSAYEELEATRDDYDDDGRSVVAALVLGLMLIAACVAALILGKGE